MHKHLYQALYGSAICDAHVKQSPAVLQHRSTVAQLQVLLLFVI